MKGSLLPWTPFGPASALVDKRDPEKALDETLFSHVARRAAELHDLAAEDAALAWEVSGWQRGLDRAERRAIYLLITGTLIDRSEGSTWTSVTPEALRARLGPLLEVEARTTGPLPGTDDVVKMITDLVSAVDRLATLLTPIDGVLPNPPPATPLLLESGQLYHQCLLLAEDRLARQILERRAASPDPALGDEREEALKEVLAAPPTDPSGKSIELALEQIEAVRAALGGSLTIVSGGPGTGKTSVVVTLLRVLVRLGFEPTDLALGAPTGKAAQRLRESITGGLAALGTPPPEDARLAADLPEAATLHRLLGANRRGTSFRHHRHDPLSERVVVIDEASMIDLHLFDRLLRAVRPDARLILLGDADQLPSVGTGTVLRDLIPDTAEHPLAGCAVRFTKIHRVDAADPAGAAIARLARAIREQTPIDEILEVRGAPKELAFAGVESILDTESPLVPFLDHWFGCHVVPSAEHLDELRRTLDLDGTGAFTGADLARLDALFAHVGRVRIVCPTRVHRQGVTAINDRLHEKLRVAMAAPSYAPFVAGDPLLATANDYEKGLFNGDQGIVLWVRPRPDEASRLRAVFETRDGVRAFPLDLLAGEVEHAFATTIHKTQGSEFDHVALVLPEKDTAILTREVLYTAVTRAKRSVTIIGDRSLLDAGLARTIARSTGLAARLAVREHRRPERGPDSTEEGAGE